MGKCQRIAALIDADLAEILPPGAIGAHIGIGQKRKTGVRTAGAIGIGRILCEAAETGKQPPE